MQIRDKFLRIYIICISSILVSREPINSPMDLNTDSLIALKNRYYAHGTPAKVASILDHRISRKITLKDNLRFYSGEYISGIFFISALFCYAFLAKAGIAQPGRMVRARFGNSLKKMLDILGSLFGLVLSTPFFIVLPILIKFDSRGPVFYTQERVGINRRRCCRRYFRSELPSDKRIADRRKADICGRPFRILKFRTMIQNAENRNGPIWAAQNDNCITRIGRVLRKTRFDEIPQLINVLMGDMSLVGPRPEHSHFVSDLCQKIPNYMVRLRVKPGITGPAQITTGYDPSIDSVMLKVKNDITYISNWSIWTDMKILMRTIVVVITGRGA